MKFISNVQNPLVQSTPNRYEIEAVTYLLLKRTQREAFCESRQCQVRLRHCDLCCGYPL